MTTYQSPSSPVAGGRFLAAQWWRDLAPGWTQLPISGDTPPGGIAAYSGMAVDARSGRLFMFGGGHNDYFGNEVWELDCDAFVWERHYPPDIGANPPAEDIAARVDLSTLPGGYIDTHRPYSRHTYASVHWVPSVRRMIAGGGSSYSGTGEYLWGDDWHLNQPQDTWLYDALRREWHFGGSTRLDAGYLSVSYSVYDPATDRVYGVGKNVSGFWVIYEYNPHTNTWSNHNVTGAGSSGSINMAVDSKRGRLLILGGEFPSSDKLWAYNIAARTWTDLTPAGTRPETAAGYGLTVDTVSDRYIATRNGTAWIFDPVAGTWEQGPSGPPNVAQVMGRLVFDRIRNAALLTYRNGASGPIAVWAYRFGGAS